LERKNKKRERSANASYDHRQRHQGEHDEQLDEAYDGLVRAISLRQAQRMGTDEALGEMLAAVLAERNSRRPVAAG